MTREAGDGPSTARPTTAARADGARAQQHAHGGSGHPHRPSLGGGTPAQGRALGAQGRKTVRKLLDAGLAEF
ncbi:MAG: hypothetical protein ACLQDY_16790, partial [Streptosporangiaceae bacterium]